MLETSLLEVPDDNVGLEAHESFLTTSNVFPVWRDPDNRDLVIMTAKEGLFASENVPDDDG